MDKRFLVSSEEDSEGKMSGRRGEATGVLQDLVFTLMTFLFYINLNIYGTKSYRNMYADDVKIMRKVECYTTVKSC